MDEAVRAYMAEIGRRGGKRSRRVLTSAQARELVAARVKKQRIKKAALAVAVAESDGVGEESKNLGPHCLRCSSFDKETLTCPLSVCSKAQPNGGVL